MLIYVIVNISILFLAFLCSNLTQQKNNFCRSLNIIFILSGFLLLFFISAFRGDFTSDYNNYINVFEYYDNLSFSEIFLTQLNQELGFILVNKIIGIFTDNGIYIFILSSFIILLLFYKQFIKDSVYLWMSLLMFITIGPYYTSFNITRQIVAVAIIFAGSKYLYERNFKKYLLIVILAMMFHQSAIIMVIFYYLLDLKTNNKKIFLIIIGMLLTAINIDSIVFFIQRYFYTNYTEASYGMTGLNYSNVVMPVAIFVFFLFYYKKLDLHSNVNRIWINAVVFYVVFSLLGLKVQMVQRLSEYFFPYVFLILPKIISLIKNKNEKAHLLTTIIVLLVVYNYVVLSGSGYDPYYFIWQSK